MTDEKFAERFANDVADHMMDIAKDDGLYRHLRFSRPAKHALWFDIVSWPGNLAIKGDMGCYTFSRIDDMFLFFQEPKPNYYYWTQKCVGVDRNVGIKEFSEKRFREAVRQDLRDMNATTLRDRRQLKELRANIRDLLDRMNWMDSQSCVSEIINFEHEGRYPFADFWEHNLKELTYHFRWCLHAIHWGVARYDAAHKTIQKTFLEANT